MNLHLLSTEGYIDHKTATRLALVQAAMALSALAQLNDCGVQVGVRTEITRDMVDAASFQSPSPEGAFELLKTPQTLPAPVEPEGVTGKRIFTAMELLRLTYPAAVCPKESDEQIAESLGVNVKTMVRIRQKMLRGEYPETEDVGLILGQLRAGLTPREIEQRGYRRDTVERVEQLLNMQLLAPSYGVAPRA